MVSVRKSDLKTILVMALIGAVTGGIYARIAYFSRPDALGSVLLGIALGAMIGAGISAFESIFVSRPDSKIRQFPFGVSVLIRAFFHSLVILFSRIAAQFGYKFFTGEEVRLIGASQRDTITDLGFSLFLISILIFIMQMRNFIGGRTFRNLLLGRYNKPKQEDRIFMIVDIVGSTTLAQHLGDVNFHRYLNRIFVLLDEPISRFDGEIHSYVGDAIFVIWPGTHDRIKDQRPLKALAEMHRLLEANADKIEHEFGARPAFRAAIHEGPVVAGETGYRKRQITYLGNTINLAARMEALTKTGMGPYLASRDYLDECDLPEDIQIEEMGEHDVKGSTIKIALARVNISS